MVSVGSTNFATRSFRLNDEANLYLYAADFSPASRSVKCRSVALAQGQPARVAAMAAFGKDYGAGTVVDVGPSAERKVVAMCGGAQTSRSQISIISNVRSSPSGFL